MTGYTGSGASKSDKKIGVVGLSLFNLRRLGAVGELSMVGVNGRRFPAIRQHLHEKIEQVYKDMDVRYVYADPGRHSVLGDGLLMLILKLHELS